MKLKLITLFFSILLILLLVNACKKRRDEPQPRATVLYGKVINRKTGDPIKGAEISFQDHEYATPSSGSYRFHEMAGEYPLITNHDDYHKDSINVVLKSNKELMKDRFLVPKRSIVHVTHQDSLHFESTTDTLMIEIENAGIEDSLVWIAESNRAWLITSPTEGTIYGEGSMSLEITINIDNLTAEKDTGTITITNGVYTTQSIEVSVCAEKDNIEVVEDPMESLSEGLVAYYPLDGNGNDESGNEHHLTLYGNPTSITNHKGEIGKAYSFDGIDDYGDLGSILINEFPITISYWSKGHTNFGTNIGTNDLPQRYGFSLIAYDYGSDIGFAYSFGFGAGSGGKNENGRYNHYAKASDEEVNEWKHIVGIAESATNIKLYVNGVLTSIDITNGNNTNVSFNNGSTKTMITGDESFLEGLLDNIRIYNKALTEEEVILLYNE